MTQQSAGRKDLTVQRLIIEIEDQISKLTELVDRPLHGPMGQIPSTDTGQPDRSADQQDLPERSP